MNDRITKCLLVSAALLATSLCGGCSEDMAGEPVPPAEKGLSLRIDTGSRADGSTASAASLNENRIDHLDVFFCRDGNIHHYEHVKVPASTTAGGSTTVKLFNDNEYWGDVLNRPPYNIYVLANVHNDSYDDAETSGVQETDFSWMKDKAKAVDNYLKKLMDTDPDVFRAEGEKSDAEVAPYEGKLFLMDGTVTQWKPQTNGGSAGTALAQQTVEVRLARAAAKIVVEVNYTDGFITGGVSTTGLTLRKAPVNFTTRSLLLAGGNTFGSSSGEATIEGNPNASVANEDTGQDQGRKQKLYLYSYATEDWGAAPEREMYVLLSIPYKKDNRTCENYYKVPVVPAGGDGAHALQRNTLYTVRVTIDRIGSPSIEAPAELTPSITLSEWNTFDITVDDTTPKYLSIESSEFTLDGESTLFVKYTASGTITVFDVVLQEYYYFNKNGVRVYAVRNAEEQSGSGYAGIKNIVKCQYIGTGDNPILRLAIPEDIKFKQLQRVARYMKFRVTSTDGLSVDFSVKQYPKTMYANFLSVFSTIDGNGTYNQFQGNASFDRTPEYSATTPSIIGVAGFQSMAWVPDYNDGNMISPTATGGAFVTQMSLSYNKKYLGWSRTGIRPDLNARMYMYRFAATDDRYTFGKPQMSGGVVDPDNLANADMLSPMFLLASELGSTTQISWSQAQEHCKKYIEVLDKTFSHNPDHIITFKDWRLPTRAELGQMKDGQKDYPDVMDKILKGSTYWTATRDDKISVDGYDQAGYFVRCVHDLTPEIIEKLESLDLM